MDKIQIANEVLCNTGNIYLKNFIKDYIDIVRVDSELGTVKDNKDFIICNNFMEYISKSKIDITGWCLWEILSNEIYCFTHLKSDKAFDLVSMKDSTVRPSYINGFSMEYTDSIEEAIEGYEVN